MGEPVTWLMAVRNGMPFLKKTLESVAAQTYREHSMLVWNDASDDGTLEELQSWIPSRIPGRIITGACFKLGINLSVLVEEARTELCARIDADDVNAPTRLERQVAHMLAHPEVAALGTQVKLIDVQGKPLEGVWVCPCEDAEARWRARWQSPLAHPSVMLRRSAALRAGNYRDFHPEDCEFWIRLSPFGEIYSLTEELLQYRRHASSMSAGHDDYYEGQLKTARAAASHLFPGLPPDQVLPLWEATHPRECRPGAKPRLKDFIQHERAARLLAQQCGKPPGYFQQSRTFTEQRYWLRQNLLQRFGVPAVAGVRRRMRAQMQRWRKPQNCPSEMVEL
jgi:Glycosyl transferase family 2